jgi:sialic acid synthase SpsE
VNELKLGRHTAGLEHPTYFIADIAANHDGDLERAKLLIRLCAKAGANAAKFQNFRASKIVSDRGFRALGSQASHQANWKKSVFEIYQDATIPWEWTPALKQECGACDIDYFSSPYDLEAVDMLDPYVELFKIGSGDITWPEMLHKIASKKKPVLLATGASDIGDVTRAVELILPINPQLVLMQCNTNYTGSLENFKHVHLRVLESYQRMFPNILVGLSDHTAGHATVLGAVALGARVVEKHFTDDTRRTGPDHGFSMNPEAWRDMVERTRELELALGSSAKFVAENERETVVLQRRCVRAKKALPKGTVIDLEMVEVLRPAALGAVMPYELTRAIGKRLNTDLPAGEHLQWTMLGD